MWLKYALLVIGIAHLIFGVFALYAPGQVAGMIGLDMETAGGRGEVRALYGGLVCAVGVAILRGAMAGPSAKQWLLVIAVLYSGLAVGRIVSLAGDGVAFHTLGALAVEGGLAAFLFYAVGALEETRPSGREQPRMDPVDGIEV